MNNFKKIMLPGEIILLILCIAFLIHFFGEHILNIIKGWF